MSIWLVTEDAGMSISVSVKPVLKQTEVSRLHLMVLPVSEVVSSSQSRSISGDLTAQQ